jgi:hypothetical protein
VAEEKQMDNFTTVIRSCARLSIVAGMVALATPAFCQTPVTPPEPISLSGPRFGLTVLSDGILGKLKENELDVKSTISQFGWQFERQIKTSDQGLTALNEWVFLVGGLDQGVALPSLSWLVGIRTPEGVEFGAGPNFTPLGVGLVAAFGVTVKTGALNVPVNFALAPSRLGMRVSVLTGFNMRRR